MRTGLGFVHLVLFVAMAALESSRVLVSRITITGDDYGLRGECYESSIVIVARTRPPIPQRTRKGKGSVRTCEQGFGFVHLVLFVAMDGLDS
jgi:hypothetical protein